MHNIFSAVFCMYVGHLGVFVSVMIQVHSIFFNFNFLMGFCQILRDFMKSYGIPWILRDCYWNPLGLMTRSDFTTNPLGQIEILTDLSALRDFKNNPLGFHEIP